MPARNFTDYASNGRQAYSIARQLFDAIIRVLRNDPRFSAVASRDELELVFADALRDTEILLLRTMCGRVHLDDIGDDR